MPVLTSSDVSWENKARVYSCSRAFNRCVIFISKFCFPGWCRRCLYFPFLFLSISKTSHQYSLLIMKSCRTATKWTLWLSHAPSQIFDFIRETGYHWSFILQLLNSYSENPKPCWRGGWPFKWDEERSPQGATVCDSPVETDSFLWRFCQIDYVKKTKTRQAIDGSDSLWWHLVQTLSRTFFLVFSIWTLFDLFTDIYLIVMWTNIIVPREPRFFLSLGKKIARTSLHSFIHSSTDVFSQLTLGDGPQPQPQLHYRRTTFPIHTRTGKTNIGHNNRYNYLSLELSKDVESRLASSSQRVVNCPFECRNEWTG